MLRFLFDTDHLTLFEQGHAALGTRLAQEPAGSVGVSVVTMEESLRGRLAHLARAKTDRSEFSGMPGSPPACASFSSSRSCRLTGPPKRSFRLPMPQTHPFRHARHVPHARHAGPWPVPCWRSHDGAL